MTARKPKVVKMWAVTRDGEVYVVMERRYLAQDIADVNRSGSKHKWAVTPVLVTPSPRRSARP